MKYRRPLVATIIPMAATSILAVSSPAALADPALTSCSHTWSNKDAAYGYLLESAEMRVGPHASCTAATYENGNTKLYYHCYIMNSDGNSWTHARAEGRSKGFWVWDKHLSNGGSMKYC